MEDKIIQGEELENATMTPDSGEVNEGGEVVNEVPSTPPEGEKVSSRAEERIRELTERLKVYEETIKALQEQIRQPQVNQATPEEEEYYDPAVKKLKQELNLLKMALAHMYDENDKMRVNQKYSDYSKYEPQIEAELMNFRKQGQNLSREQIYLMLKAREVMTKPVETTKPKTTTEKPKPVPESKSVRKVPPKPQTLEEQLEQLKDVKF
ncbi:MAG TPA: hypothetical protein PKV21_07390 [bacterium]|nr:hypothetical protein [bacterium]